MEVATFYGMYNLKPVGKYKLAVCTNLTMRIAWWVNTAEYLHRKLNIAKLGGTSADGKFTVIEVQSA